MSRALENPRLQQPIMVLIPVKTVDESANGDGEWSLIELQGKLESQQSSMSGADIGTLTGLDATPTLTIGHHKLLGKRVKLVKPVAVLVRRTLEDIVVNESATAVSSPSRKRQRVCASSTAAEHDTGAATGNSEGVEYHVVGIARSKLLFNSRPVTIVSRPAEKAASKA